MEEKNNEMVELVEVNEEPAVEVEVEESGMSTGMAMLLGSGLTLAIIAGVKKGREAWARHKARKAEIESDATVIIEDGNAVDPSDDSEETQDGKQ